MNRRHVLCSAPGIGLLLLAATTIFLIPAGPLTFDSGTYHLMTLNQRQTLGFTFAPSKSAELSPEHAVGQLRISDDRLVSQYPELWPLICQPFHFLFGFRGFYITNALAYIGIGLLVVAFSGHFYPNPRDRLVALGIYTFAMFSWEYTIGSYPHTISTLCLIGAATLGVSGLSNPSPRQRLLQLLASGICCGAGVCMRLDSIFGLASVVLPLLIFRPLRPGSILCFVLGLLIPAGFLMWTNQLKFGSPSPFNYGTGPGLASGVGPYLPLVLPGLAVLTIFAIIWHLPERFRTRLAEAAVRRRKFLAALCLTALCAGGVLFFPQIAKSAHGLYQILIDLRIRDTGILEPALSRTPNGGMIYLGGLKKSLLQSCPYLIALPFAFISLIRSRVPLWKLAALVGAPMTYILIYGYLAWHGSVAMNMRYLVPCLPFLAIAAADLWANHVRPHLAGNRLLWTALASATVLIVTMGFLLPPAHREWIDLNVPMALALGTFILLLFVRFTPHPPSPTPTMLAVVLACSFLWSGAVAFISDATRTTAQRLIHANGAAEIRPHLEAQAVIFTRYQDFCWLLFGKVPGLTLLDPSLDDYADFEALATFYLMSNRPVYSLGLQTESGAEPVRIARAGLKSKPVFTFHALVLSRLQMANPGE